jgi:hypothetical protein
VHELEDTLQEKRRRTQERERELESALQEEREKLNERLCEEELAVSTLLAENHSLKALVVMLEEQVVVCVSICLREGESEGAGIGNVRISASDIDNPKVTAYLQAEGLNLSIRKEDGKNKTLVRCIVAVCCICISKCSSQHSLLSHVCPSAHVWGRCTNLKKSGRC